MTLIVYGERAANHSRLLQDLMMRQADAPQGNCVSPLVVSLSGQSASSKVNGVDGDLHCAGCLRTPCQGSPGPRGSRWSPHCLRCQLTGFCPAPSEHCWYCCVGAVTIRFGPSAGGCAESSPPSDSPRKFEAPLPVTCVTGLVVKL